MAKGGKLVESAVDLLKKGTNGIMANLSVGGVKGLEKTIHEKELSAAKGMLQSIEESSGNITEDSLKRYAKKLGTKESDLNTVRTAAQNRISGLENAESSRGAMGYGSGIGGNAKYAGRMAYEYMWGSASGVQRATRIGTAASAYMGGAALLRGASSYGTNNRGESDIAGIPFI
jgi:transcriptional regulator with XRE-family HTH domain